MISITSKKKRSNTKCSQFLQHLKSYFIITGSDRFTKLRGVA